MHTIRLEVEGCDQNVAQSGIAAHASAISTLHHRPAHVCLKNIFSFYTYFLRKEKLVLHA